MTVRKYLGQLHGTGATSAPSLSLPPDIHLQCGEVVMQLCEDPFEAKLRANYEVSVCMALGPHTFKAHHRPSSNLHC